MREKGQIIPGIKKLIEVEDYLRKMPKAQPRNASQNQTIWWKSLTPEELRKIKKESGVKYMGDVGK